MKCKTWVMVAVLAALPACSTPGSKLIGKWAFPGGSRAFEFKSDRTMTERSQLRGELSYTLEGSGTWEATEDTLTWTLTTVQFEGSYVNSPLEKGGKFEEVLKKPHKWLYTLSDKNTMRLTGSDGTVLPLVRVPSD